MTAIAYDLFDNTIGIAKVQVLRFASIEAAKNHAASLYGEIVGCDEAGRVNRFSVMITGGYSSAPVYGDRIRTTPEELAANARLIAAAPDMLAALRLAEGRLALLLRVFPDQSNECDHPTATGYVLKQVQAAITKTTTED